MSLAKDLDALVVVGHDNERRTVGPEFKTFKSRTSPGAKNPLSTALTDRKPPIPSPFRRSPIRRPLFPFPRQWINCRQAGYPACHLRIEIAGDDSLAGNICASTGNECTANAAPPRFSRYELEAWPHNARLSPMRRLRRYRRDSPWQTLSTWELQGEKRILLDGVRPRRDNKRRSQIGENMS